MIRVIGRLGAHRTVKLALPARRILAYLALRGHPVSRCVAAADLWPDMLEDIGRANLRRALWHLPPGWVEIPADELVLAACTDLAEVHRSAAKALGGGTLFLEEITGLSQDILPGWHEEWVLPAQEAFHLLRVQALEFACRTMTEVGSHELAIQAGAAAIAAEPLRESAAEALINAHLAQRNRYAAIQCFELLAQRLNSELGVSPDRELTERVLEAGMVRQLGR
jgi:DNA-binding SARP family transcriptional activator